jgi:hypothetical protein
MSAIRHKGAKMNDAKFAFLTKEEKSYWITEIIQGVIEERSFPISQEDKNETIQIIAEKINRILGPEYAIDIDMPCMSKITPEMIQNNDLGSIYVDIIPKGDLH